MAKRDGPLKLRWLPAGPAACQQRDTDLAGRSWRTVYSFSHIDERCVGRCLALSACLYWCSFTQIPTQVYRRPRRPRGRCINTLGGALLRLPLFGERVERTSCGTYRARIRTHRAGVHRARLDDRPSARQLFTAWSRSCPPQPWEPARNQRIACVMENGCLRRARRPGQMPLGFL